MSSSPPLPLKIGIIGFGPFAQFLTETMLKQGHSITATSRTDYSHLSSELGIKFFRDVEKFCEVGHDVILICTSILSLSEVGRSIPFNHFQKPTLFVDVLSVKEYPKDLLLHILPETCDLLCTHPMFGPESGKDGWKYLPLVYEKVRIRDENICTKFLRIFENERINLIFRGIEEPYGSCGTHMLLVARKSQGCRMVEMSCTEHDMFAARSQFLTHTIGRILSEMEIESTPMDTKGFQTLLQLRDNTVKDSFDLYCGLYKHNKFAKQELDNLELAFQRLKQKLLERTDRI